MARERVTINTDNLVSEYRAGRAILDLAREFDISRDTVAKRLVKAGVTLRTQAEQNVISFARMGPDGRAAMTKAAHDAVRGRPKSFESKVKTAIAKQRTLAHVSPLEMRVMAHLRAACIDPIPQLAVGPYNCDLACHPVAVEIFGGSWHFSGRHMARAQERIHYLGDAGWHVLMLVNAEHAAAYRYTDATRDYLVSYIQQARANPTAHREYRVVDCRGETLAAGRCDDDNITIEPAFGYRQNPATGRYERVPR